MPTLAEAQLWQSFRELLADNEYVVIFRRQDGFQIRTVDAEGNRRTASAKDAGELLTAALTKRLPGRVCRKCKKEKSLDCFPRENSGRRPCYKGHNLTCNLCEADRLKDYREKRKNGAGSAAPDAAKRPTH